MKQAVIIFSGFNQRAVIAFIRTLEARGINYGIIASSSDDTIFQTGYAGNVVAVRSRLQLNKEDLLECIATLRKKLKAGRYMIAPSTEALNRFLLKFRQEFETGGCYVPLVDEKLYENISDKFAFSTLCREHGIRVPAEYDDTAKLKPPYVAKPRTYVAADGQTPSPVIVLDRQSHEAFLAQYRLDDFYFQQHVAGDSLYLLYCVYENGSIAKLSQQNFLQQPDGKSILAASIADFHETTESAGYEKLLTAIGFRGLVMIEVKRVEGRHYMIEANPRFWGPSQLFVDAGANLFECLLYDYGILRDKPTLKPAKEARYFWFGGLVDALRSGKKIAYHTANPAEFSAKMADWLRADVYNREDTRSLFTREAGMNQ